MEISDLPNLLNSFKYNSFPKKYTNFMEALDELKIFINENWEKLHKDIIKMVDILNEKETYFDYELYLFDCLRFPIKSPIVRYRDGLLKESLIEQFPFNKYSYHDSEINYCAIKDKNLIINLDLIEKWESNNGNGWNQVGNTYNMVFSDFTLSKKNDNNKYVKISNNEIVNIKNCTILSCYEIPLINYYRSAYDIPEKVEVNKRVFVFETLFNNYSEFVITASLEKKEKLTNNSHLISYAISIKK
jgi:hypothetical protein